MRFLTMLFTIAGLSISSGCNEEPAPIADTLEGMGIPSQRYDVAEDVNGMYTVNLANTELCDLAPLSGLPISILYLTNTKVTDVAPLSSMPLTELSLAGTQVSDLSPLKGMSLKNLGLRDTPVENLKPLQGMPLNVLNLLRTRVKDLSPLKGAPLTWLTIVDSGVTDLTPLEGMPLEKILFHPDRITKGMDVIRNLKSLNEIGWGKGDLWKPDEFWRKYEAGEFKQQDNKHPRPEDLALKGPWKGP